MSRADKDRLDWLEMQCVEVRTPLVHGSRENFRAIPDDSYEGEDRPSDLRAKIDAAMDDFAGSDTTDRAPQSRDAPTDTDPVGGDTSTEGKS